VNVPVLLYFSVRVTSAWRSAWRTSDVRRRERYPYHRGHLCDLSFTVTAPFARQTSNVRAVMWGAPCTEMRSYFTN